MVRFIFACMTVVAIAFFSIAGQFVVDGISDAQQEIAARNAESPLNEDVASRELAAETEMSAAALNNIESAAGSTAAEGPDEGFGAPFTEQAPAALKDDALPARTAE